MASRNVSTKSVSGGGANRLSRSSSSSGAGGGERSSDGNIAYEEDDYNEAVEVRPDQLFVLDGKRAQNIIIGLTQFKPSQMGDEVNNVTDILNAIMSLNRLDGKLSLDRLNNFTVLLPSDTEVKKLRSCSETRNVAELFLKDIIPYYPMIARRLQTFIICEQFASESKSLLEKMMRITDMCLKVSVRVCYMCFCMGEYS